MHIKITFCLPNITLIQLTNMFNCLIILFDWNNTVFVLNTDHISSIPYTYYSKILF